MICRCARDASARSTPSSSSARIARLRCADPCPACSRLIDLRWDVCPYCSVPVDRSALAAPPSSAETVRILEDARAGRRKRAVAAAAQRVGIEPDELDAFTNALSGTPGHPAVGAGAGPSEFSRRWSRWRSQHGSGVAHECDPGVSADSNGSTPQSETVTEPGRYGSNQPASGGKWVLG